MKKKNKPLLETALEYAKKGLSVIPINSNPEETQFKKPFIPWKEFQSRIATPEEITQWWNQWPNANIGIITGDISGVAVVDIDGDRDEQTGLITTLAPHDDIPETLRATSGSGGIHFYFQYDPKKGEVKNGNPRDHVDLRGEGGYIIAHPSYNPKTENSYEWISGGFDRSLLKPFPYDLFPSKKEKKKMAPKMDVKKFKEKKNGIGSRNTQSTRYAGKLLKGISPDLWDEVGWKYFQEYNQKQNTPPLEEVELKNIWESVKKAEESNEPKTRSQAKELIHLVEEKGVTFFCDQKENAFARIPKNEHFENIPCRGNNLEKRLSGLFWQEKKKAISAEALRSAIRVFESKALYEGEKNALSNRAISHKNAFWYDLTNENWQVVKITPQGWEMVNHPPVLFRRYSHQKQQVTPNINGDIKKFLEFVNIQNKNHEMLLLVWLVSSFIPKIPHTILIIKGIKGSAKSSLTRACREIIDPSQIDKMSPPSNLGDWPQVFEHNYCIPFDNLRKLTPSQSDFLCRAVTGDATSSRALYTDDEDVIREYKRVIILNGINLVADQSDLIDRAILISLDKIEIWKHESKLHKDFEDAKPAILGGVMDTLSKAMSLFPQIEKSLEVRERMADFTLWGCAISEALGYGQEAFLTAYRENIQQGSENVIDESVVAQLVLEFMRLEEDWKGTPTEFFVEIKALAKKQEIPNTEIPKRSNQFSRELNTLKPNLEEKGCFFKFSRGNTRQIHLEMKVSIDGTDGIDEGQSECEEVLDDVKKTVEPIDEQKNSPLKLNDGADGADGGNSTDLSPCLNLDWWNSNS
jgi:hypothetical protein